MRGCLQTHTCAHGANGVSIGHAAMHAYAAGRHSAAHRPHAPAAPHRRSSSTCRRRPQPPQQQQQYNQRSPWPVCRASAVNDAPQAEAPALSKQQEVLSMLRRIMDPDFGMDIVECGFVKVLDIDDSKGHVDLTLELTTPACPVKDQFKREATQYVQELPWVSSVAVTITAQPKASTSDSGSDTARPGGLRGVRHIIAVSSCKGGVGKSTTAVNLAYTLAQMGAKVGIFDADVYGPSLPTMVSPELPSLQMNPETRAITPTEYQGVSLVSFGFAGQGSAIMRGAMVSGLIQQMLTTSEWGELDYLVLDFPPGTGDIQLTLCQSCAITAAVIVTTPQKLAFIDVAKGIRMFAKLSVPCVAVVENMSFFDGQDGQRYYPFGRGSGDRIVADFGLPHLVRFPIVPDLSQAGDGGVPLVVSEPDGTVGAAFMQLGAAVVQEVAKLSASTRHSVSYDAEAQLFRVAVPGGAPFALEPSVVRENDTSASAIDEWTGQRRPMAVPDGCAPVSVVPLGNYAVQVSWDDGHNQVVPFELLEGLRAQAVTASRAAAGATAKAEVGGLLATANISG